MQQIREQHPNKIPVSADSCSSHNDLLKSLHLHQRAACAWQCVPMQHWADGADGPGGDGCSHTFLLAGVLAGCASGLPPQFHASLLGALATACSRYFRNHLPTRGQTKPMPAQAVSSSISFLELVEAGPFEGLKPALVSLEESKITGEQCCLTQPAQLSETW